MPRLKTAGLENNAIVHSVLVLWEPFCTRCALSWLLPHFCFTLLTKVNVETCKTAWVGPKILSRHRLSPDTKNEVFQVDVGSSAGPRSLLAYLNVPFGDTAVQPPEQNSTSTRITESR